MMFLFFILTKNYDNIYQGAQGKNKCQIFLIFVLDLCFCLPSLQQYKLQY